MKSSGPAQRAYVQRRQEVSVIVTFCPACGDYTRHTHIEQADGWSDNYRCLACGHSHTMDDSEGER